MIHTPAPPQSRPALAAQSSAGRRAACLLLALAASLSLFSLPSNCLAGQTARGALTPLQREIERERARLGAADAEERRDAVQRLGAMRRPDAARAAASALRDPSEVIRATAAHAILAMPADEAAALLVPLLADKKEFVRRETAYALGEAGSRAGVEALLAALARDKEAGVRGAAAVALGRIGDERAVAALAEALGRRVAGTGFFSRITRSKTEENEFVRRAAAEALGRIGSRAGVPALVATLADERAPDDVRRESARALAAIGDPAALPALRAALTARDPYLARIAFDALRKLDPAHAAPPS
ncbi:MAG TPA: HEAT repeat domain-containing protein [Pyrinomonadaceae bacterium]|jgi:HEAT repeat protein